MVVVVVVVVGGEGRKRRGGGVLTCSTGPGGGSFFDSDRFLFLVFYVCPVCRLFTEADSRISRVGLIL